MALASGCSLSASMEAAFRRSSSSVTPLAGKTSVTVGRPSVSVPVLSTAMTAILPVSSRASLVLNKMPFRAPTPLPTMMATGVARPRAHGHEMTSTEMARVSAKAISFDARSHPMTTRTAMPITAGTKTADTRSAIRAMGALVAAASDTRRMICASVVSSPTRVARHRR